MLYNQMKQKRKAKSLISMSKVGDIVSFPRLLLTIGGLFCLAALSLFSFTIYVNAQVALQELGGQNEITETDSSGFSYSWLNDNVEVIYEANFVDPDNTYNIGGRIYMDNAWNKTNLVIQWNTFLNWENNSAPNSNRNANILWWKNNIINANNITTLWWEENIIYSDNVAVLWWKGNNISDRNISIAWGGWSIWGLGWLTIPISQQITPKVLIGSKNSNIWIAWTWSMIIWWSGNAINSKNSAILWWSENEIINISWWIIIAWQKVNVNKTGLENVFVFSDGRTTFQPQSSNAFYLNTQKWLWLNMASNREWVDSKWAVSFWNINTITCNANNVGLVWLSGQCLYGCTMDTIKIQPNPLQPIWTLKTEYKREPISDSKACNPKANSEPDYDGFCNGNKPDSTRTKLCDNLDPTKYVDVQFSYEIREKCPSNQVWENQCVYVCKEWYSFKDGWCYKNCKLPISLWWNLVAHGTVITWYTNALPNPTCLDECKSWSMQCKDGNWYVGTKYIWNGNSRVNGFVRLYDCTTQPKTCGSEYKYSTQIANATCTPCTAYGVNNNQCVKPWTKKYKCECNTGYTWDGTKCNKKSEPKCTNPENIASANAVQNNNPEKTPSTNTAYYYSTGNEACTFSCNDGYTWDGTKCKKPEPKCTNPENITNAYAVQNNNPEKTPIANTPYYYSTDNEACTFSCDNDKWRNPIKKQCQRKSNLCETTHYKCKAGATSHNQSESPEKYTWKCINNLDNSDIYQCSEIKDNNTEYSRQCPSTMEIPGTCTNKWTVHSNNWSFVHPDDKPAWPAISDWIFPIHAWDGSEYVVGPWCRDITPDFIKSLTSPEQCYAGTYCNPVSQTCNPIWKCLYWDIRSAAKIDTGIDIFWNPYEGSPYISMIKEPICADGSGNKADSDDKCNGQTPPVCWWIIYNDENEGSETMKIFTENEERVIDAVDTMYQGTWDMNNEVCRTWYHVPTSAEWEGLINTWKNLVWEDSNGQLFRDSLFLSYQNKAESKWWNGTMNAVKQNHYWTITSNQWLRLYPENLWILNNDIYQWRTPPYQAPLRCFKNKKSEGNGVRTNIGECAVKNDPYMDNCVRIYNESSCNRTSGCTWEWIGSFAGCTSELSISSVCHSLLTNNECSKIPACSRTSNKVCLKDEARCKKESITAIPSDCILPDEECMYRVHP